MDLSFVTVIRNGIAQNILDSDLQLEDVVLIQAGEIVPADLKLTEARFLEVDEFDVTGELLPVSKPVKSKDVFVYMGSRITRGSAKGVVIALGEKTAYGKVLNQAAKKEQHQTIPKERTSQLWILLMLLPASWQVVLHASNKLTGSLLLVSAGIILLILQDESLIQSLLLKREQQRLHKRNILFCNTEVLPLFNDIDIVCFDKTGVLTTREVEISKIFLYSSLTEVDASKIDPSEKTQELIRTASILSTDISFFEKIEFGKPIDQALISFAKQAGADLQEVSATFHRVMDMPFDSEKRFMSSGYETVDQEHWYFLKGDPDVVLSQCKDYYDNKGEKKTLDYRLLSSIKGLSKSISQKGDSPIVIAIATGDKDPQQKEYTFLCLVQFVNTLHPDVKEVIGSIIATGRRPILLTGDKSEAALKIAHACGISQNSFLALSGNVIIRMIPDEVGRQAEYCSVFSRLLPSQKATIIRQLQKLGHQVMMVGDGPNDGIALNNANIGISFHNESSPVARKNSQILINQLKDLPEIFLQAKSLKLRLKRLRLLRVAIMVFLLAAIYVIAFVR